MMPIKMHELKLDVNNTTRTLNVYSGDLTKSNHKYDFVFCSAFKSHYGHENESFIKSLDEAIRPNSIENLSNSPKINGKDFGFWISKDLNTAFCKRVCCFELEQLETNDEVDFRSIFNFFTLFLKTTRDYRIKNIATPLLFTNNYGLTPKQMIPVLLETALDCFKCDNELEEFSIYIYNDPSSLDAVKAALENLLIKHYDVFISYPHENKTTADSIFVALEKNKIKPWIDRKLKIGDKLDETISSAISDSRIFLFLWFDATEKSDYCKKELNYAIQLNKKIVPYKGVHIINKEGDIWKAINNIKWFDGDDNNHEALIAQINDLLVLLENDGVSDGSYTDSEVYFDNDEKTQESERRDTYHLERFIIAQNKNNYYDLAVEEIKKGKKRSEWMWFVFPQIVGLGRTNKNEFFSIKSLDEAKAYLEHPVLGNRLIKISRLLLKINHNDPTLVFGFVDSLKLKSSMTLFYHVSNLHVFKDVLTKFYKGEEDKKTLDIVNGK